MTIKRSGLRMEGTLTHEADSDIEAEDRYGIRAEVQGNRIKVYARHTETF